MSEVNKFRVVLLVIILILSGMYLNGRYQSLKGLDIVTETHTLPIANPIFQDFENTSCGYRNCLESLPVSTGDMETFMDRVISQDSLVILDTSKTTEYTGAIGIHYYSVIDGVLFTTEHYVFAPRVKTSPYQVTYNITKWQMVASNEVEIVAKPTVITPVRYIIILGILFILLLFSFM